MGATELNIVRSGVPDAIFVEARDIGWQESLRDLRWLGEAEMEQ